MAGLFDKFMEEDCEGSEMVEERPAYEENESENTQSESEGILAEAAAVAESQSGDKFPSVPTMDSLPGMPSTESKFM